MEMECIDKHIVSPAVSLPVYNPPSTPFRLWKHRREPSKPYKYPICVPASAIALSAKKQNIDLSKYDFVGLRRSIKRILSFSPQLNTNFQMINGTIFAEDVPIMKHYYPYNFGYQLEIRCCSNTTEQNDDEMKEDEDEDMDGGKSKVDNHKNYKPDPRKFPKPFKVIDTMTEQDKDDIIGIELDKKRKKEDDKMCEPLCKDGDYYHLVDVEIGDLKLLLCAEIDGVDEDGNALELKFGSGDKHVSVWSQCLLSGIKKIVQAQRTFQTLCTIVTGLSMTDIDDYFCSNPHRNAQLMVFYNVLKDIKQRLSDCQNEKGKDEKSKKAMEVDDGKEEKGEDDAENFLDDDDDDDDDDEDIDLESEKEKNNKDDYVTSKIYRLSRHHTYRDATMFEVGDVHNLITRTQWKFINEYNK